MRRATPKAQDLANILRNPTSLGDLSEPAWETVLRQAIAANLQCVLALLVQQHGIAAPPRVQRHLTGASALLERQARSIRWELEQVLGALEPMGVPVMALKGAAYAAQGHPVAAGRLLSDIDILVPEQHLDTTEKRLAIAGWMSTQVNAYDQRYYRRWMHELPPLTHVKRHSQLDVHHRLLPRTCKASPDAEGLWQRAERAAELPELWIPCRSDLILHSIIHLFYEGELHNGLRDLYDLHRLLLDKAKDEQLWQALLDRAEDWGVGRALYYAVANVRRVFDTAMPDSALAAVRQFAPHSVADAWMEFCYTRALAPVHPLADRSGTRSARRFLYVRGHWLRMPLHLLAPHLMYKALRPD